MRRSRKGKETRKLTIGRIIIIVIVLLGGGLAYLAYSFESGSTLQGFSFPCAGSEGTAIHIHPYIQIIINGQNVTVPAGIGIVNSGTCFEPVHVHDNSGIIHVESPNTNTQYTLAQFFQIWNATYHGVAVNGVQHPIIFNSTDILGFRADSTHKVVLLVDGKPSSDYGALVLNSLDYCGAATTGPPLWDRSHHRDRVSSIRLTSRPSRTTRVNRIWTPSPCSAFAQNSGVLSSHDISASASRQFTSTSPYIPIWACPG